MPKNKIQAEFDIQKEIFEKEKNKLKEFAKKEATTTELSDFRTFGDGLFGFGSHKVTGVEANNLVEELQSCFIEINERERKVIKEFEQVYKTFEALDKNYIEGILIGVKSAEQASKEAKNAQKDVNDTINALQLTIDKLREFKDEVNKYKHLKDIDDLWDKAQKFEEALINLSEQAKEISTLQQFRASVEKNEHFSDIDSMWNMMMNQGEAISNLSTYFGAMLEEVKKQLLEKIDEIEGEMSEVISEMTDTKDFINGQEHIRDVDESWDIMQSLQNENAILKGRLNLVCIIAGSAMGLSVVQILLQWMGVL